MQKHETEDGTGGCLKCMPFIFIVYYSQQKKYSRCLGSIRPFAWNMFPILQDKDVTFPLWTPLLHCARRCTWCCHPALNI